VVDILAKPVLDSGLRLSFPGDGRAGCTLLSFSFDRPILFGFENSFIFELFAFGSDGRGGGGIACEAKRPGEGKGLLPFGKAALAALVAASLLPPTVPFEYDRALAELTCGL